MYKIFGRVICVILVLILFFSCQSHKLKLSSEAYCSMSRTQTKYKYLDIKELAQKVEELEKKCDKYFKLVFKMLKQQEGFNIELFEDIDILEKEISKLKSNVE